MDRIRLLIGSRRWLFLAALALVSLALGSAMFSGARFGSKSSNTAALGAGSLQLSSSKANQAIVAASAMKPGDSRQGTINISNEGDLPGTVSLQATGLTGTALAAVIDLKIEDTTSGTTQVYSGKLGSFTSVNLTALTTGTTRTYRFTLSWPSASNSASLQGASASLTFLWSRST